MSNESLGTPISQLNTDACRVCMLEGHTNIYFVRNGEGGEVKIGIARDLVRRFRELQVGNPVELRFVASWLVHEDEALRMERRAHTLFERSRVRGEWFAPDPVLIDLAECIAFGGELTEELLRIERGLN